MSMLEKLKDSEIVICLIHQVVEQKHPVMVTKLVEIENSGIWIEGRDLANFLHESKKLAVIPRMPLFFVPFTSIAWIAGSDDYPSLSEKHLGL